MWRLCSLFLLFSFLLNQTEPSTIRVEVSKKRVHTGEVFTYKVKMELPFTPQEVRLPEFEGLKVISRVQQNSYNVGKGRLTVKIKIVFKLVAYSPGKYIIKEVVVKGKERTITSKKIEIEVYGEKIKKEEKKHWEGKGYTI